MSVSAVDPDTDPYVCYGPFRSGSVIILYGYGSIWNWIGIRIWIWIRILPSTRKKVRKTFISSFSDFLKTFIYENCRKCTFKKY